jgi:hypothetical protein
VGCIFLAGPGPSEKSENLPTAWSRHWPNLTRGQCYEDYIWHFSSII